MFLLDTGARRGELADLQLTDLDLDLDVAIVPGKGRRERALPYGRKTAVALDRYPLAHAWLHKAAANRPDAACRLEVPPDARPQRHLGCRRPPREAHRGCRPVSAHSGLCDLVVRR